MSAATTPSSKRPWLAGLCAGLLLMASAGAAAQACPGRPVRLVVAAPTGGGTDQLARLIGERLAQRMGQPFIIDNRGGAGGNIAAIAVDVVAGQVPVFFTILGNALPFEKSGQVRILGVGSARRLPGSPEMPTIAESGYPTFEAFTWFGFLAPAGTPPELTRRLLAAINAVVSEPAVAEKMRGLQFEPTTASAEDFGQMLRDDLQRWTRTVRDARIKTE